MNALMERVAAGVRRWRWAVLAAWVALVIVAAPLAARQSEDTVAGGFTVPGSQSEQVRDALARDFDSRTSSIQARVFSSTACASDWRNRRRSSLLVVRWSMR